jgi:hypothetical protein
VRSQDKVSIPQDQESTAIDDGHALQSDDPTARSVYPRLVYHGISTVLFAALAVVETWYMFH